MNIDDLTWEVKPKILSKGLDFSALKTECDKILVEGVLPFWKTYGTDHEYGGFICGLQHDGSIDDDSKFSWYQGRGAWVFAQLFQKVGDVQLLEIARHAITFIQRYCFCQNHERSLLKCGEKQNNSTTNSPDWWSMWTVVNRTGGVIPKRSRVDDVGYAVLFYAEGLAAVARHEMNILLKTQMLQECMVCNLEICIFKHDIFCFT